MGLVVHAEFLLLQRLAQCHFQGQPPFSVSVHVGGIEPERVAPCRLGPHQSSVGTLQQGIRLGAVARRYTNADAGGNDERLAVDLKGLGNCIKHAFGQGDHIAFMAKIGHDEPELIARAPPNSVAITHLQIQAPGHFHQYAIARRRA